MDNLNNERLMSSEEFMAHFRELSLTDAPQPLDKNRRPTVNNNGWQFSSFNVLTLEFLQQISAPVNQERRVYEIGAAMGNVAMEALKKGQEIIL